MITKIKQYFCKHEWERDSLVWIFPKTHVENFYKCKKCGKTDFTQRT